MSTILDSKVLRARKKDVEDVIYKKGNIRFNMEPHKKKFKDLENKQNQ